MYHLPDHCQLTYTDKYQTSLTIASQEKLCYALITEARKAAEAEDKEKNIVERTLKNYYDQLALFMEHNPQVLIELILLKPDLYATYSN